MANLQNLMPIEEVNSRRTREQHSKDSSKAGKASVKAKRERKALREQLELLLKLPIENPKTKSKIKKMGISEEDIDNQMAMTLAIFQKAAKGNVKAYELIRDTLGEKPVERVNVENAQATKVLDSINKQLSKRNK